MGRISLHKHTHINARRRRYAHLQGSQPISSLLDNQLFHTKAGVAYLFSIIGCMAYNYLLDPVPSAKRAEQRDTVAWLVLPWPSIMLTLMEDVSFQALVQVDRPGLVLAYAALSPL
ncbi:hypothetical protein RB195_025604 [Necator americanus]|uniref:EamA domain-containing protein n=1 Tax=Necator americanus TaxID=51031 RepID=A0ABR1ET10_NECAM